MIELTTRNCLKTFRSVHVPKPNFQKNVNNSGVTEEKKSENKDITKNEFNTKRLSAVKDWEAAKEFAEEFIKLTTDSNKNLTLFNIPEVVSLTRSKSWKLCPQCLSTNCSLMNWISRKNKKEPKFLGQCKRKAITLGEVPNTLEEIKKSLATSKRIAENHKKKKDEKKKTDGMAAEVTLPAANYGNNSADFMNYNHDMMGPLPETNETYHLRLCSMEISTLQDITKENLPVWDALSET